MDFSDSRLWYSVVGVIVVLLVIAYGAGWFGGITKPPLTPTPTPVKPEKTAKGIDGHPLADMDRRSVFEWFDQVHPLVVDRTHE
jgi:hypothetical protein